MTYSTTDVMVGTLMSSTSGCSLVTESVNEFMDFFLSSAIGYEGSVRSHWDRILESVTEYDEDE